MGGEILVGIGIMLLALSGACIVALLLVSIVLGVSAIGQKIEAWVARVLR